MPQQLEHLRAQRLQNNHSNQLLAVGKCSRDDGDDRLHNERSDSVHFRVENTDRRLPIAHIQLHHRIRLLPWRHHFLGN